MNPSVRLLNHTPNPVRSMALAARLCYTKGMTIEQVDQGLTDEKCMELFQKVLASRHMSVLEHSYFMFGVEGVSRNFSHQMVRHRNTSYEQQSLHYTMADESMEVAAPAGMTPKQVARRAALKSVAFQVYKDEVAEGVPREEARHNLPSGLETKLVMSANLRQWLHFVTIRSCVVNCQEILVVAHKVKKLLQGVIPELKPHLGPTCWTDGTCHEGKKFCEAPWKDKCLVSGMGVPEPYVWSRPRKQTCAVCGDVEGHNGLACPHTVVTGGPC